jgi:hypothetical protein
MNIVLDAELLVNLGSRAAGAGYCRLHSFSSLPLDPITTLGDELWVACYCVQDRPSASLVMSRPVDRCKSEGAMKTLELLVLHYLWS